MLRRRLIRLFARGQEYCMTPTTPALNYLALQFIYTLSDLEHVGIVDCYRMTKIRTIDELRVTPI